MNPDSQPIDVFARGDHGINNYRIPSLIVAPGGTLLAFCEAREGGDASPTDLVLRRSADPGRSWQPMQRVLRCRDREAYMNPCPVVDGDTVLLFCVDAHRSGPGHHRQLVLRSADDGATWSEPVDVTRSLGDDTFVPGPGVSIRLRSGRLIVPGYRGALDKAGVAFSDDRGDTWALGRPVEYPMSNECQAVELSDGSLLLNWRIENKTGTHPGCRGTAISRDGGESWSPPKLAHALNEAPCQAGLIGWRPPGIPAGDGGLLLFSNPDARPGGDGGFRTRMTIRISADDGSTWPYARLVHPGPCAYSCPAVLPDGRIGLLYECGETWRYEVIRFAAFAPDDLMSPAAAVPPHAR